MSKSVNIYRHRRKVENREQKKRQFFTFRVVSRWILLKIKSLKILIWNADHNLVSKFLNREINPENESQNLKKDSKIGKESRNREKDRKIGKKDPKSGKKIQNREVVLKSGNRSRNRGRRSKIGEKVPKSGKKSQNRERKFQKSGKRRPNRNFDLEIGI